MAKKITSVEAGGGQRAPAVWSVAGAGGVEAGGGRPELPGWRAAGAWPAAAPRLSGDARAQPAAAPGAGGEPRAEGASGSRVPSGCGGSWRAGPVPAGQRGAASRGRWPWSGVAGRWRDGARRGGEVRRILREFLESEPLARTEYAEAVDGETFQPLDVLRGQVVLPLAVRIGGTRLIDNFQLAIPD